nr:MAG TPA: Head fiber protein [Caudoviricetes sp.]
MANITLDARQQQKHDTSTNFNNANKLYLEGEFLVETDTGKVKIGDGTLGYKSLPYTIGTRVPEGAKFTDTTYTAGTGLSLNGTSFSISNSGVTAGSYGPSQDSSVGFGDSIDVPYISVNSRGQITSADSRSITLPSEPTPTSIGAEPAFAKNTAFNKNFGSAAGTVCQGNDSRLSNARPASDVSAWAKEPNKPTYTPTEVGVIGTAPTSGQVAVFDGTTGKIKSTGFTIASSVPSGAKFTDTTYSAATSTALGLVKVGYTESGRNYPVELDADDKMFVNVPWTDTNTTYSQATSSTLGLIKIGYTESGKNYPIELNTSGQAFVNVPWTDTTYSVATTSANGLMSSDDKTKLDRIADNANNYSLPVATSSVRGGIKIGYTESGKNYPVELSNEQAYVNVPWEDTTYSVFTGATTTAAGTSGLVPAPTSGQSTRYLCSTGEWSIPTGTIYNGSTAISVKPSTTDGEYNIYLVALFPGTTSQSVGPSASGTINFGSAFNVPHITIDQYGRITALANRSMILSGALASSSAPGLCPKLDSGHPSYYLNANGTWSAPRGRVYGVKGNAETAYREGQVNLTAANIGALPITGGTVSGATTFSDTVTLSTAGSIIYDDGFYDG